ncbi:MAG TPA: hypothetical protein DCR45_10850 [Gammaproteobacteria bacterium]|nr:hypothetical protein [Gammaproteobacteria bacterium]HAR91460.1 hypothetical protein [Gammaproteobacteria bacterium]|tara:strand:- start:777 stop:1151 length:375 start_codon:yes stop_codon:yes gene_type:complete
MSWYLILKHAHITFAVISFLGFSLRGYWMVMESALLQTKAAKILPHLNDTLLLGTAIALVVMTRQYPIVVGWVTLKILMLILYIVFGTFALKRGRNKALRIKLLMASVVVVPGIFLVAMTKPGW